MVTMNLKARLCSTVTFLLNEIMFVNLQSLCKPAALSRRCLALPKKNLSQPHDVAHVACLNVS